MPLNAIRRLLCLMNLECWQLAKYLLFMIIYNSCHIRVKEHFFKQKISAS